MRRKLFYLGVIFLLLVITAATPISVRAEGDPPPIPEPIKPPWITGKNPAVSLSTEEEAEVTPAGVIDTWNGLQVPLLAVPPSFIELEPQIVSDPLPVINSLAVPQQYQDPADVTCGTAALGMAMEFLSLTGEGEAPLQNTLVNDLKNSGLLYDTGTGVEELAYLARQHGYQGTIAFHNWNLAQLAEQLSRGKPVVVSLGANGEDQPGHFVTLTGISTDGKWVSYNDPILGNQTVSAVDFNGLWSRQGNSGLLVQKEALYANSDPMLPWMGLFSAMAVLAVMAKQVPLGEEIAGMITDIRKLLSNPSRKGYGGKLDPGGAGGSSSPPYSSPAGYKWIQKSVPKYGWKNLTTTHTRQVPIFEKKKVQVDTQVWFENVPRYRTVRVDRGSWVNKKVTLYRRKKYVRYYRTSRVRKTRLVRRGWRLVRQTYYVTKRTPVYGYKSVPYRTYYKKEWKSKWVTERQLDGYTKVRHEKPVYEHLMMPTGRTKTEYYPKTEKRWGVIGTELEWKLKKVPTTTPAPNPPKSTPTVTTNPTPPGLTLTPTPSPTEILEETPIPSATPSPNDGYFSQYELPYAGTSTPMPDFQSPTTINPIQEHDLNYNLLEKEVEIAKNNKTFFSPIYKTLDKLIAASKLNISEVDDMLIITGSRAARSKLGFNPYTNWIKPDNVSNVFQGLDDLALKSANSPFTALSLFLNTASNSIDYAQGDINRYEFAAATTVDTGITIGTAMLAGAIGGAIGGAVVGAGVGAIPGAIIGGLAGAASAIITSAILNGTGARDIAVNSVADMYQDWVEGDE